MGPSGLGGVGQQALLGCDPHGVTQLLPSGEGRSRHSQGWQSSREWRCGCSGQTEVTLAAKGRPETLAWPCGSFHHARGCTSSAYHRSHRDVSGSASGSGGREGSRAVRAADLAAQQLGF